MPGLKTADANREPGGAPGTGLVTTTLFGRRVTVNAQIVPALKRVEAGWLALGGNSFYRIYDVQGYHYRTIAGTNTLSWHARGMAIDINPTENAVNARSYSLPPQLIALFKQAGFGWGGDWKSKKDYMHFSAAPNEGGDWGKLGITGSLDIGAAQRAGGGEGAGHVHEGSGEPDVVTEEDVRAVFSWAVGRDPTPEEIKQFSNVPSDEEMEKQVLGTLDSNVYRGSNNLMRLFGVLDEGFGPREEPEEPGARGIF